MTSWSQKLVPTRAARIGIALLVLWIAVLAALTFFIQRHLVLGTDLRLFLPSPTTPEQHLLVDEIGESPASRVLVMAVSGGAPEELADASRALADELSQDSHFRFVTNGELSMDSIPDELLPYRYLLSDEFDTHPLNAEYLHTELLARSRDLSSPAGAFLEPWLPRDPTLELLKLLQRWQPMQEPNRMYDVWFDRDGKRALLIAQTKAPAFDPAQQREALDAVDRAFNDIDSGHRFHLELSGAGKFSVLMQERTQNQAQMLGTIATVGMIVLLLIAYRSFGSVILSSLPLASAGIAGLATVSGIFGTVHGVTLAFGFTLIGVAQDYPVHLLSHRRPNDSPFAMVRHLWPTLATGVASTCIAYLTFLFTGVIGLAQLACFTIAGLATASLTTRFLLPYLLRPVKRDLGDSRFLAHVWRVFSTIPRPAWAPIAIALCALAAILASNTRPWESDLSKLTPVPRDLLIADEELRAQLGTPDMRYMLVLSEPDAQHALQRLESLQPELQSLVAKKAISGYDDAARYLPSLQTQRNRQLQLPPTNQLRAALAAALQGTSFRSGVFEPFIKDVERARTAPLLTLESLRNSILGVNLEMLLSQRNGKTTALITLTDVQDLGALQQFADKAGSDVLLLDLKDASESLVSAQRTKLLWSLGIAAIVLTIVIAIALRSVHRTLRVLTPMTLTTLLILAVLRLCGVSLTLFHLIAFMLAAGLGLDYALFFEHAADDPHEQRRTLHAVLVSSVSTLMVFALLGWSDLPVLRAIGVTVTLGVVFNFVLALIFAREYVAPRSIKADA
jgi:predicted exporter